MESHGMLDFLPLWALFGLTLVIVLASVEAGYRLGRHRRQMVDPEKEASVGTMVGATLGLLAFMLAFTFGLAASRFDERRRMVVDEANAIGTTWLRSHLVREPERTRLKKLLEEYVNVRLTGAQTGNLDLILNRSPSIHNQLWADAVTMARQDSHSITNGLFLESLNGMIDIHSKRIMAGLRNRIHPSIWITLYVVAILSMLEIGYHEGLTSTRRSLAVPPLVVTFATVMLLIADLDRPREGLLTVSQQAMVDLQNSFTPATGIQGLQK